MAAEKNFENKVKRYLESIGVYDLGTGADKMKVAPCGYYEKRWGGGYSKAGLPDMHIVVCGVNLDVELKASNGRPSELQNKRLCKSISREASASSCTPKGLNSSKKSSRGCKKNAIFP